MQIPYPFMLILTAVCFFPTAFPLPTALETQTSNLTTDGNLIPSIGRPLLSQLWNTTHTTDGNVLRYVAPNALTTVIFRLGFPMNTTSLRITVGFALAYCEKEVAAGSTGPLPLDEDPFIENQGWGTAIEVVSARPDDRLTWEILDETMQGLWQFLIVEGHSSEVEFKVFRGKLVGRGTVESRPIGSFSTLMTSTD